MCRIGLLLFLLLPGALPAQGHTGTAQVEATLIPESRSVQPGVPLRVALRLVIAPGWHIYWTNPGESGLPTVVHLSGSTGLRAGAIDWPYPELKTLSGISVHSYEGEIILLAELYPSSTIASAAAEITARMSWGVCRDVCIRQDVELSLSLPVRSASPRPDPRWSRIEATAAPRMSRVLPGWVFTARRDRDTVLVKVTPPVGQHLPDGRLTFFPDDPMFRSASVANGASDSRASRTLRVVLTDRGADMPSQLRGVLVAPAGWDRAGRVRAMRMDVHVNALATDDDHDAERRPHPPSRVLHPFRGR